MTDAKHHTLFNNLLYSCVDKVQRSNEQFVAAHSLGYIVSGQTHVLTSEGTKIFGEGTIALVKRNQLLKSVKVPPQTGDFKAINIIFNQDILRDYSVERQIQATGSTTTKGYHIFQPNPFLKGYFDSLLPYFDQPGQMTDALTNIKTKEAIELVLRAEPAMKDILFDFAEPYKIDLELFMQQHYMYNVPMEKFARLTGRSLASFKRDFEKIFKLPPGRWLQGKRLAEAHYLISQKGRRPSDIYLEVGFENLSHFSYAFKKEYGVAPSML